MDLQTFFDQFVIVSVLFQKKWENAEVITSVVNTAMQVGVAVDMIVFDNSPNVNTTPPKSEYVNFEYYCNQQNNGVSEAYNRAAAIANQRGKKWILITDCDFTFGIDLISAYYVAVRENPDCKLFSPILVCGKKIISPYKKVFHRYQLIKHVIPGVFDAHNTFIVNNGMFCAVDVFTKTGGYCQDIMLDFSDDYFISRYLKHYHSFVIIDFQIYHKMSSFEKHRFISARQRFSMYCDGAYQMSKLYNDGYWFVIWSLFRANRLCFKYRNLGFLRIFFNAFFQRK